MWHEIHSQSPRPSLKFELSQDPFEFARQTYRGKSCDNVLIFSENHETVKTHDPSFSRFVTAHSPHRQRQTDR